MVLRCSLVRSWHLARLPWEPIKACYSVAPTGPPPPAKLYTLKTLEFCIEAWDSWRLWHKYPGPKWRSLGALEHPLCWFVLLASPPYQIGLEAGLQWTLKTYIYVAPQLKTLHAVFSHVFCKMELFDWPSRPSTCMVSALCLWNAVSFKWMLPPHTLLD